MIALLNNFEFLLCFEIIRSIKRLLDFMNLIANTNSAAKVNKPRILIDIKTIFAYETCKLDVK